MSIESGITRKSIYPKAAKFVAGARVKGLTEYRQPCAKARSRLCPGFGGRVSQRAFNVAQTVFTFV